MFKKISGGNSSQETFPGRQSSASLTSVMSLGEQLQFMKVVRGWCCWTWAPAPAQLLRRKLIMYFVLQPDMADLSVSQAEAPGETINHNNKATLIYENIVVWSDVLQESSSCCCCCCCRSLQGSCRTLLLDLEDDHICCVPAIPLRSDVVCKRGRASQSISAARVFSQHCGLQGEFVMRNRAAALLASWGLTRCRHMTGQK